MHILFHSSIAFLWVLKWVHFYSGWPNGSLLRSRFSGCHATLLPFRGSVAWHLEGRLGRRLAQWLIKGRKKGSPNLCFMRSLTVVKELREKESKLHLFCRLIKPIMVLRSFHLKIWSGPGHWPSINTYFLGEYTLFVFWMITLSLNNWTDLVSMADLKLGRHAQF